MKQVKKTLVVGGSTNPDRFSYKAIHKLTGHGYPVVSIGLREGEVSGVQIEGNKPAYNDIHTVTLYIGPRNQPPFYDYLLGLKPKRIIFNPGTENEEFEEMALKQGINVVEHCTLVMLDQGIY